MKNYQESLGGPAEEYRKLLLNSETRHDTEINQLKNTIRELQEQVYSGYKRQSELINDITELKRQLNASSNTKTTAK